MTIYDDCTRLEYSLFVIFTHTLANAVIYEYDDKGSSHNQFIILNQYQKGSIVQFVDLISQDRCDCEREKF